MLSSQLFSFFLDPGAASAWWVPSTAACSSQFACGQGEGQGCLLGCLMWARALCTRTGSWRWFWCSTGYGIQFAWINPSIWPGPCLPTCSCSDGPGANEEQSMSRPCLDTVVSSHYVLLRAVPHPLPAQFVVLLPFFLGCKLPCAITGGSSHRLGKGCSLTAHGSWLTAWMKKDTLYETLRSAMGQKRGSEHVHVP